MFEPELCQQDSIREIDQLCIENYEIPGLILMEHASIGIAQCALDLLGQSDSKLIDKKIVVCCGPGGNGGDGFAAARHLHYLGAQVQIIDLAYQSKHPDRTTNHSICQKLEIPIQQDLEDSSDFNLDTSDLIIDALLGSGITRKPEGAIDRLIDEINRQSCPVLSIDLPSGLFSDSGKAPGKVIKATRTVTLCLPKLGFLEGSGPDVVGELWICPIGAPPQLLHGEAPVFPPVPSRLQLKPGFPHLG